MGEGVDDKEIRRDDRDVKKQVRVKSRRGCWISWVGIEMKMITVVAWHWCFVEEMPKGLTSMMGTLKSFLRDGVGRWKNRWTKTIPSELCKKGGFVEKVRKALIIILINCNCKRHAFCFLLYASCIWFMSPKSGGFVNFFFVLRGISHIWKEPF